MHLSPTLAGVVCVRPDNGCQSPPPAHWGRYMVETGDSPRLNCKRRHHHGSNSFLGPDCFPSLAGEGETPASKIIFNVLDTHPTKVDGNFSGHIHSNYRSEIPHPNYETIYHTFTQYGTFTSEGPVSCNNRLIWKLHSPEGNLVTFF